MTILEEEDDDGVFDEMLNDWANLETVNSCHPMYFAKKIAEVCSPFYTFDVGRTLSSRLVEITL